MKNSRRDFIKKAGLGSAAITIGGTAFGLDAKSYSQVMGANSRIRIAHIGVNSRGDELAKNFVKQKNAEIIYICDVDERAIAKTINTVTSAGQPAPKGEKDFRIASTLSIMPPESFPACPTVSSFFSATLMRHLVLCVVGHTGITACQG